MSSQQEIQERIQQFPERCRSAGLKLTHQRTAIFGMLAASNGHPSPEEVFSAIRRKLPSISLATVYKVLDQFQRHGFLRKVSTEGQVARYDANLTSHHHLICDQCGLIQDIPPVSATADITVPEVDGFRVSHFDLIYHGLCEKCGARTPQAPA